MTVNMNARYSPRHLRDARHAGTEEPSWRYRPEQETEVAMGFGRGLLFWLLGIPLPIIILLALFWHN